MGNFGFSELLLIGGVIFFLFGAKKIPDFAKSLGQGLRIFKEEMNQVPRASKESDSPTKSV